MYFLVFCILLPISVFVRILTSSFFQDFFFFASKVKHVLFRLVGTFKKSERLYEQQTYKNYKMRNGYVNLITRPLHMNFQQYPITVQEKFFWHVLCSFPIDSWQPRICKRKFYSTIPSYHSLILSYLYSLYSFFNEMQEII